MILEVLVMAFPLDTASSNGLGLGGDVCCALLLGARSPMSVLKVCDT